MSNQLVPVPLFTLRSYPSQIDSSFSNKTFKTKFIVDVDQIPNTPAAKARRCDFYSRNRGTLSFNHLAHLEDVMLNQEGAVGLEAVDTLLGYIHRAREAPGARVEVVLQDPSSGQPLCDVMTFDGDRLYRSRGTDSLVHKETLADNAYNRQATNHMNERMKKKTDT